VNDELRGFRMELLAKVAGRPFTRLFAVGQQNDDTRTAVEVLTYSLMTMSVVVLVRFERAA
jgi:hypothetical protein